MCTHIYITTCRKRWIYPQVEVRIDWRKIIYSVVSANTQLDDNKVIGKFLEIAFFVEKSQAQKKPHSFYTDLDWFTISNPAIYKM